MLLCKKTREEKQNVKEWISNLFEGFLSGKERCVMYDVGSYSLLFWLVGFKDYSFSKFGSNQPKVFKLTYTLSFFEPENGLNRNNFPVEPLCVCMTFWPCNGLDQILSLECSV
jgi:hypothetical protein